MEKNKNVWIPSYREKTMNKQLGRIKSKTCRNNNSIQCEKLAFMYINKITKENIKNYSAVYKTVQQNMVIKLTR